jgi:hypothetical protein
MVGRATLCWCTAEFHIPPLWSLPASLGVMWPRVCLLPTRPRVLDLVARGIYLRIARLQLYVVFLCDSQSVVCPCSSSAPSVEVAGRTKSIPCQARLLFEMFRNEQLDVGVAKRLLVSLFYLLLFLHRFSFSPHRVIHSDTCPTYQGCICNSDLMIIRHGLFR